MVPIAPGSMMAGKLDRTTATPNGAGRFRLYVSALRLVVRLTLKSQSRRLRRYLGDRWHRLSPPPCPRRSA